MTRPLSGGGGVPNGHSYILFVHDESESAVRSDQLLHPEENMNENQPTRVSMSCNKFSYYMSPP